MGAIHTFRYLNSIIGIGRSKLIIAQFQNQKVSCNDTSVDQSEAVYCRRRSGFWSFHQHEINGYRREALSTGDGLKGSWVKKVSRNGEELELRKTTSPSHVLSHPQA